MLELAGTWKRHNMSTIFLGGGDEGEEATVCQWKTELAAKILAAADAAHSFSS